MRSTILDVAKVAGVSAMTVSRFLHQPALLKPATRLKVQRAVERLQYIPNENARTLLSGRTSTVALVVADVTNPFFTAVARGAEDVAVAAEYTLVLGNSDERLEKERSYLRTTLSRRMDGLLLSPAESGEHHIEWFTRHKIPVVLIDREVPGAQADTVLSDSFDGARQLVAHLVARGYKDIAFIGGQPGVSSLEERLAGYREAMRKARLAPKEHLGRYDQQSGEEIMTRMVSAGEVPRAVIAANNYVAVGALVALRRAGLSTPGDVALACFGDLEVAAMIDPFLTVIAQPAYEMGRLAMEALLERMRGFKGAPRRQVLPVKLIARRST
jgi:LacI family transcriptional regulator, galactose operon repressor